MFIHAEETLNHLVIHWWSIIQSKHDIFGFKTKIVITKAEKNDIKKGMTVGILLKMQEINRSEAGMQRGGVLGGHLARLT